MIGEGIFRQPSRKTGLHWRFSWQSSLRASSYTTSGQEWEAKLDLSVDVYEAEVGGTQIVEGRHERQDNQKRPLTS
jgi:hypothetical protein